MKIRLLLPKGSLNTPGRGDTGGMLKQAGYDITGYESKRESSKRMAIRNESRAQALGHAEQHLEFVALLVHAESL